MMLRLEIFGANFKAHFRQYQQGSPQKHLLRFGRSAGGNRNLEFSNTKVMVRRFYSQLGGLGGAVSSPAGSEIFSFFEVFLRIKCIV